MLRRLCTRPLSRVATVAATKRHFTDDIKKLYESDFDKGTFPVEVVAGDGLLFAKFLFRAAEQKNSFDAIIKDFDTVTATAKKLGVFWERTVDVTQVAELKSCNPATLFTMRWMQTNALLEEWGLVQNIFLSYANARNKKLVAVISIAGSEKDCADDVKAAKEYGKTLQKQLDATRAAFSLEFVIRKDPTFVSGWSVDVAGLYHSTAKGAEVKAASEEDVDYTNVPAVKHSKTTWEDSVETEVLRKYLDSLAQYDAEEAKLGV